MSAVAANPLLNQENIDQNGEGEGNLTTTTKIVQNGSTDVPESKSDDIIKSITMNESNNGESDKPRKSGVTTIQDDSSTVDSGFDDNSSDSSIVTAAMLEEEEKLQKKIRKDEEKLRRDFERQQYDEEMKKMRYKRLMNLLDKSQFYADFMYQKVTSCYEKGKRKDKEHKSPKIGTKRKRPDTIEEFSEDIVSACKRPKEVVSPQANTDSSEPIKENGAPKDKEKEAAENKTESRESVGESEKIKKVSKKSKTTFTSMGIEVSTLQPKLLEGTVLRDYQLDGLKWLTLLFESGLNGILADEMGLGKTVQVISLICHLYENDVFGPFLIVGPLSTMPNWVIEFERFAPQVPVVLYHGPLKERLALRKHMQHRSSLGKNKVYPVVLTSYEIPVKDEAFLSRIRWKYIIVDEGHRLKNYKTQLARTLSAYSSVNRLLLTGTPLQNNLTELWSLLHFLLPDIFNSLDVFQSWFEVEDIEREDIAHELVEQEKKNKILSVLHKILSPFLLRREKSEVDLKLPPKKEVLVYCPMSQIQRKLYEAILDRSILKMINGPEEQCIIPDNLDGTKVKRRSALRKVDECPEPEPKEENSGLIVADNGIDQYVLEAKILNPMMALRKALNHPYLIHMPVLPGSKILRVDEGLVTQCGKFAVLDGLLSRLKKHDHKVIIFSTFTSILDLLEDLMHLRDYDYERLDGRNKLEERKKSIHRFNTNKNVFAFLISTRAGGLGINLTSADTAIIYDSDWNPQADLQAQDRCHRIGQIRPVVVYRFITEGSLDEKIYSRASAKRKLEKLIIHGGKFNQTNQFTRPENFDLEELKKLLNSKPDCRELRTDGSVMTEEEWNELLDRSDLLAAMKEKEDS